MANWSSEAAERKCGLTADETATIGLVTFVSGLLLTGLDIAAARYFPHGSYDERILPAVAAVMLVLAALTFVNLDRFKKSRWELIAVPSPLYGALVCAIIVLYNIGKLFHFV